VGQTKLASSLDNVWAHYKIVIDCLIDLSISRSFLCRFRRLWNCRCWRGPFLVFVLAAAAAVVVVPRLYERQQNGWQYEKLQANVSAAVELWQTGFNSLIDQHVRFNRALTPLFDLQYKCRGQWHHCFIWCRVVRSRDVRSRVFSRTICMISTAQYEWNSWLTLSSVWLVLYLLSRFLCSYYTYLLFTFCISNAM